MTIDVPTTEQRAEHLRVLVDTGIPYHYRAAVEAERRSRPASIGRPSNARGQWEFYRGQAHGIEVAVQALFGYFFHDDARLLLQVAVDVLNERQRTGG